MSVSGFQAVFSGGTDLVPPGGAGRFEQPLTELSVLEHLGAGADASHVASPGALFGDALERMRGFLKRADAMSRSTALTADGHGLADGRGGLHAGPALASLEPIWSADMATQKDGFVGFNEITQHVLESLSFALEADLVAKTTSQVGKSINTLVKGQ